jgi:hypothetical protein
MRPESIKLVPRILIFISILSVIIGAVLFAIFANGWLLSDETYSVLEESSRTILTYVGVAFITFGLTLGLIFPVAHLSSVIDSRKIKNSTSKHQQIQAFNDGVLKQHSSRRLLLENMGNSERKVYRSNEEEEEDEDIESSISKGTPQTNPVPPPTVFDKKYTDIELHSTNEEMKVAHVGI